MGDHAVVRSTRPDERFAANSPDNEVAVTRARLRHVERDPKFRGSPHDACGVKRSPSPEEAARLAASANAASARSGHVRADDADSLTAVLKWYQSDVVGKRRALRAWFEQWQHDELRALEALVTADPSMEAAERALGAAHPFVRWRLRWANLYRTHHDAFLDELHAVCDARGPGHAATREDLWSAVVAELAVAQDGTFAQHHRR